MRPVLALTALALLAAPALGQTWVPVQSGSPPGTPAEVVCLPSSSHARSTVEVRIHGFWRTKVVGADGLAYDRLEFPGLGELGQVGAPELPAARPRLAIVTDASTATLIASTGAPRSFDLNVYPTPTPELDLQGGGDPDVGDPNGQPEQFHKDAVVYGTNAAFPASPAGQSAKVRQQASFTGASTTRLELFPVSFNPVQQQLLVAPVTTYVFDHGGAAPPIAPITKDRFSLGAAACINWDVVAGPGNFIAPNLVQYDARYLIVTPEEYLDELEGFVQFRKSTGYAVTTVTLESLPFVTCGEIRGAIDAWYQSGAENYDHYCLLVGDESVIPYCLSPNLSQVPGDDLYGSPSGSGDLEEEVFVGRLSIDGAADLTTQLDKIVAYETDTTAAHDYSDVLLVAHEEGAPGKYVGAHEEVANAAYAFPPNFAKLYGDDFANDNSDVVDAVDAGQGVVAYRGHGTSATWSNWGFDGSFHRDTHLPLLDNSQLPVVWSFSCTNGALDYGDGIGEAWMETDRRAVAHYGSTRASGTSKNHTLDKAMFEAVFDLGVETHAQAIAYAEDVVSADHAGSSWQNEWMYLLLGDPALKLRRGKPKQLGLAVPSEIPAGTTTPLTVVVTDDLGNPVSDALVTVYKPAFEPGLPDEVFANAYTGTGGTATIPVGPTSLGLLIVIAREDDGNVAVEGVASTEGAFKWHASGLQGSGGAFPLIQSASTLHAGQPASVKLTNGLGFAPGALAIGAASNPTPLFGGTVYPVPYLKLFPFVTDGQGKWTWSLAAVPPGQTPGDKLYWQAVVLDDGAVEGFALTNALQSTFP